MTQLSLQIVQRAGHWAVTAEVLGPNPGTSNFLVSPDVLTTASAEACYIHKISGKYWLFETTGSRVRLSDHSDTDCDRPIVCYFFYRLETKMAVLKSSLLTTRTGASTRMTLSSRLKIKCSRTWARKWWTVPFRDTTPVCLPMVRLEVARPSP